MVEVHDEGEMICCIYPGDAPRTFRIVTKYRATTSPEMVNGELDRALGLVATKVEISREP